MVGDDDEAEEEVVVFISNLPLERITTSGCTKLDRILYTLKNQATLMSGRRGE